MLALLSMQDAIETAVSQPAATLPREEMDKLIAFMQIKFGDDREKQQWEAEINALKTHYRDTAKSGLMFYNLLSKTFISLHDNAPQLTSGAANIRPGLSSSKAATAGAAFSVLEIVPMVDNPLTAMAGKAFSKIDENLVTQKLLVGLDKMATTDDAGTPLQQRATMQRLTHALVYRLALHHCEKLQSDAGKAKTAVNAAIGTNNRSINSFRNYAQKITNAIMKPDETFNDPGLEDVVTSLLTAALTGATRTQDRARVKARLLGEKHQQIISNLVVPAGHVAIAPQPITASVTTVRLLPRNATWIRPTAALLPEVISEMAIQEPPLDEPVTPKTQRLLHKMYRSSDEEKVRDAGDRLEARMQMKQVMQQNEQLRLDNDQLRVTVDQLQADARNPDREQQMLQDAHRLQNEMRVLTRKVSTLEQETGVGTSSDDGLIAALMPPPRHGRLTQGQDIEIAELNARADDHAQRIDVLQGIAGIAQIPPPAPGPNENNNRRRLFGNLWNREGRR